MIDSTEVQKSFERVNNDRERALQECDGLRRDSAAILGDYNSIIEDLKIAMENYDNLKLENDKFMEDNSALKS